MDEDNSPNVEILTGNVATVEAALNAAMTAGTLDAAGLAVLREAEVQGKNRDGVLSAIGRLLAANEAPVTPKPAAEAKPKPWLREDYNGPITCDQALARNKHLRLK